jgi:uncharacterized protein YndB with AHSA1/START domain
VPTPSPSTPQDSVVVTVRVAAEPATVFACLTDTVKFAAWMGKGSTIDARVGGAVTVPYPTGETASGTIVSIEPNSRITWTWGYDAKKEIPPGSTRVTITLEPEKGGTLVTLTHTGLPTAQHRAEHAGGWRFYIASLASSAADAQFAGKAEKSVDAYISAWNEPSHDKRAVILAACLTDDATFRDQWASSDGRDSINATVTNALAHMPGISLHRSGPVMQCHGHVSFRWEARTPDGTPIATGADFGHLDLDARLSHLVGFWDRPTPPT